MYFYRGHIFYFTSRLTIKKLNGQPMLFTLSSSSELKMYRFSNMATLQLLTTISLSHLHACFPVQKDGNWFLFFQTGESTIGWTMSRITTTSLTEVAKGLEDRVASGGCTILQGTLGAPSYIMLQRSGYASFNKLVNLHRYDLYSISSCLL